MPIRPIRKPILPDREREATSPAPFRSVTVGDRVLHVRCRVRQAAAAPVADPANDVGPTPARKPVEKIAKVKASKKGADRPKKQPTGDYVVGYCRAPVGTQFDGSSPGPGRPPGALSQDTLLKKHLIQSRAVAIEGKQTKVQNRELVLMMRMKDALSGNRHAADYVLAQAARLFTERTDGDGKAGSLPIDVDAHDRAILDTLEAALLAHALREGGATEEDDDIGDRDGPDANGDPEGEQ